VRRQGSIFWAIFDVPFFEKRDLDILGDIRHSFFLKNVISIFWAIFDIPLF